MKMTSSKFNSFQINPHDCIKIDLLKIEEDSKYKESTQKSFPMCTWILLFAEMSGFGVLQIFGAF